MTSYRLFPATDGPSAPVPYSGNFIVGAAFAVTAWNTWFEGFWWWVPPGGDTGPQKFTLWEVDSTTAGVVVPGTTVTSGPLTAGQWNQVLVAAPLALSVGVTYVAATGWVAAAGFPQTPAQFGAGEPYGAGITNGPLTAFSDAGGSNPVPNNWFSQSSFGKTSSDPTVQIPNLGSDNSANFWMDVQVSDTAPAGVSYRLWPGLPVPLFTIEDSALNFTIATEFNLAQPCTLDNIWFYTPPGTSQLPTACGIWDVTTQTLVAGTDNESPAWSGAAASGWVACAYRGLTLPAGDYRVAVVNGAASPVMWNLATIDYWSTGPGGNGITSGPLSAPNLAAAASPGQGSYHQGPTLAWPDTYATGSAPVYWVDVEVTPQATAPAQQTGFLPFFP